VNEEERGRGDTPKSGKKLRQKREDEDCAGALVEEEKREK